MKPARGIAAAAEPSPQIALRGQQVYRANCAVCHGVTGDGNGNGAHMLRIRPGDGLADPGFLATSGPASYHLVLICYGAAGDHRLP